MGEKCGGPYDRSTFPYRGGITSADIHSPVYYFVTAGLTTVIQAVSPVDDLLIAARMTGALWLGLGLVALIWLCRELGAGRSASGAVALLVLSVPIVRWTNTYVTPDAMNLLWGSLISIAAFGLVPLLFASGPGSEIQKPLAIVVIGGLVSSTLLTLLLLPLLYRRFGIAPGEQR